MTVKAYDALASEREAAEAEGLFTPTAAELTMLKRYKQLKARADEIATEMEAIKSSLIANMDEKNARALVVNGKNWVLISDSTKSTVDKDALEAEFPGLSTAYADAVAKFTTRVTLPRHTKTVKPA